jgi:hypothetical protein
MEINVASTLANRCACPDCICEVRNDQRFHRDGKGFCSDACANLHPHGIDCPSASCNCDSGVRVGERRVTEANIDEALDETFPASDPISP